MNVFRQIVALIFLLPSLTLAQTWQAQSGEIQLAVLELFTAEGCGLCPAADRWVDQLPQQGINDDQLIVLGFHVDYLDDKKGWIDRFASPVFSDRQRQLARLNLYQTVYTPEFVVSGEVIHNWRQHLKELVKAVNGFKPEAHLEIQVTQHSDQLIIESKIDVIGDANQQFSMLYLAVTENNIESKIGGGDNAGATFHHQNLVRKWLGPFELNQTGHTDLTTQITIDDDWNLSNSSIVAVVQNLEDGFVLQGLKLPLVEKEL
ncbi:MAG: DUF1223 domain-containing protein [Gammaproteobacteria bacterium]|nr:DUF1223 domain-containing protein [Gammaproteobacteria bacterium]